MNTWSRQISDCDPHPSRPTDAEVTVTTAEFVDIFCVDYNRGDQICSLESRRLSEPQVTEVSESVFESMLTG